MSNPILVVNNLRTEFKTRAGVVEAVSDVSFEVRPGETMALVGESGSGKAVTALSIMRLLDDTGRIAHGSVEFEGTDLASLDEKAMREIRGRRIALIFQDPSTCLDPVFIVDVDERIAKIQDIQRYALENVMNPIPVWTYFSQWTLSPEVQNFYRHASYGFAGIERVWLDESDG